MATSSFKTQFDLQTRLFNNVTEGFSDSEANARNNEHVNHIKWISGHLLNTRLNSMSKAVGLQPDDTYGAQFGRGASLDPHSTYPPLEEIRSKWNATSAVIGDKLNNLPEEVLAIKVEGKFPVADDTVRGLLAFLLSHESYHIGQMGILRKQMGKEAMSYN